MAETNQGKPFNEKDNIEPVFPPVNPIESERQLEPKDNLILAVAKNNETETSRTPTPPIMDIDRMSQLKK